MAKSPPTIVLCLALLSAALTVHAYTPDPQPDIDIADTDQEGAATVVLETSVSGADIYLNRVFVGRTPQILKSLPPGVHVLRLELEGYRSRELILDLQEKRTYTIKVALVRLTGWLSISSSPPDASFYVDGKAIQPPLVEVPAGIHSVRAYRFGYLGATQTIQVPDGAIVSVDFTLAASPFEISELRVRRKAFNPANLAALGRAEAHFSVTSFGHAVMEIRDSSGEILRTIRIPPFTESLQTVVWNGSDDAGRRLPDGDYSLLLRAFPDAASGLSVSAPPERRAQIRLDSSILIAPRGLSGAVSGLILYPDPYTDPDSTLRFSAAWKPLLSRDGSLDSSSLLLGAQLSLGGLLELGVQAALDPESSDTGAAGFGVKRVLYSAPGFSSAVYLTAGYSAGSIAGEPASPPAARLGVTGAIGSPRLHGGLALEIEVPSWDEAVPRLDARAGFALASGLRSAGLSVRARTDPLDGAFALANTVSAALEASTFLAPLPLALGLSLGVDFGPGGIESLRPSIVLSLVF